jgi:tetratricopeptide (TPR) repeat protein
MILFRMGRFGEAEAATRSALVLSPGDFECLWIIGNCRLNQGDPIAAEQFLRLAVAADSGRAVGWKDLGAALNAQDRLEEAIKASETAVALDLQYGGPSDSFVNLAIELAGDGRAADAIALHERMLPEVPEVYGHIAYAQALLRAGRLEEGWNHLEFRFLNDAFLPRRQNFGRPVWSGQDLKGKTVLLLAEQGLGGPDPVHSLCASSKGPRRVRNAASPRWHRGIRAGISRRRQGPRARHDANGIRLLPVRNEPAARVWHRD